MKRSDCWKAKISGGLGGAIAFYALHRAADSDLHAALETPISFTLMVHHMVLYKLKPEVTPARVEEMMMNARMQLLKIPEVLSIKCGKRIDPETEWPFFLAIDFESMDKFAMFREDSIYVKFVEEVVKPNTEDSLTLDFEMDPGKDVRFS
jgi:Stress responsive A/B Barrel Domain